MNGSILKWATDRFPGRVRQIAYRPRSNSWCVTLRDGAQHWVVADEAQGFRLLVPLLAPYEE